MLSSFSGVFRLAVRFVLGFVAAATSLLSLFLPSLRPSFLFSVLSLLAVSDEALSLESFL